MMEIEPWILQVIGMGGAAAITWGAIRADIKHLHEQLRDTREGIRDAHRRIDETLRNCVKKPGL